MTQVEAVVFWMDDSNVAWITERERYKTKIGRYHHDGKQRYRSFGMIDVCLASLLRNASWISRVSLISPGHTPKNLELIRSLNPSIPIRVLDEKDIIPTKYLPLYNAFALETFIHLIPDLCDYIMYLSDDMIFMKPTRISEYIVGGKTIARYPSECGPPQKSLTQAICTGDFKFLYRRLRTLVRRVRGEVRYRLVGEFDSTSHYRRALHRTSILFRREFGQKRFVNQPHFPLLLEKQDLQLVADKFHKHIEKCRKERFRGPNSIEIPSLAFNYAIHDGRVLNSARNEAYFPLGWGDETVQEMLTKAEQYCIVCLNDELPDEVSAETEEIVAAFVRRKLSEFCGTD